MARTSAHPDTYLPPPASPGAIKWLKDNLFKGWLNILLTILSGVFVFIVVSRFLVWVVQANWAPVVNFPLLYSVGQYPRDQLWRLGIILSLTFFLMGVSWRKWGGMLRMLSWYANAAFLLLGIASFSNPALGYAIRFYLLSLPLTNLAGFAIGGWSFLSKRFVMIAWVLITILSPLLIAGLPGLPWLKQISTTLWGGLLVTFVLSVGGIVLSFPIGVILALGRRSKLPVVNAVSTLFIEIIRGVPLITLLFMFSIIVALFLPPDSRLDRLLRALIAMTIFSAVYVAENVRGGLQAVPNGQIEAARALGMNGLQITGLIVLPQALRAVIPAMVGQFIALFKDTTLVVIVGINDFLGIGQSIINSNPEFIQAQLEVYLFIAAIYWVFSYFMSLASRRLETSLGVGKR